MSTIEHKKMSAFSLIRRYLFVILGALLAAVALEILLVPNQIIDGGIVGISIILSELTNHSISVFLIILNIPFIYIGYKQLGKFFAFASITGIGFLSLFTTLLHHVEPLTKDPLLATVFGGMLLGIGVGLVIRNGGSMDGTEVTAILVSLKTPVSVGQFVMFINLFILSGAGFVFGWDKALYSLLAYYLAYKVIDIVVEGFDQSKSFWIISDNHKEIADAILTELKRGVTYLNGEGAYSGEEKKVLFVIITRLEESKLKDIVNEIDPKAFVAIGNINEVKGGRSKKKPETC